MVEEIGRIAPDGRVRSDSEMQAAQMEALRDKRKPTAVPVTPPPAPASGFDALSNLLALMMDPEAYAAHIAELKERENAATERLKAADERERAVAEREKAVGMREQAVEAAEKDLVVARARAEADERAKFKERLRGLVA